MTQDVTTVLHEGMNHAPPSRHACALSYKHRVLHRTDRCIYSESISTAPMAMIGVLHHPSMIILTVTTHTTTGMMTAIGMMTAMMIGRMVGAIQMMSAITTATDTTIDRDQVCVCDAQSSCCSLCHTSLRIAATSQQ
jgi:hypothetical protein